MKISKRNKKALSVCVSILLTVNICSTLSYSAADHDVNAEKSPSDMISGAISYIGTRVNEDKSIGDNRLVNDTAYAIAALRTAGGKDYEDSVKWLAGQADSENTDVSARIASALGSPDYLDKMQTKQNGDYGFGLYPGYSSDVIDSVLVLDAINETGYSGEAVSGSDLAAYLSQAVNDDGGFAYAEYNRSDPLLTAVAVYDIGVFFANHNFNMSPFAKSVTYVAENITDSYEDANIQKTICKHLALKAAGKENDLTEVVSGLRAAQKADGSFAGDITATYWAVKLLAGESSQPSQSTATTTSPTTTTPITSTTTTTSGSTTSSKTSVTVTTVTTPDISSTTTTYTGNKILLKWDDLSVEGADIRYQVFRRVNGSEWESYSAWDGKEKIDVLNVYPTEPYLAEWMTEPLEGEDTPAGKDLMSIASVNFSDFNSDPEKYMYDEDGSWKYDVVFFGAADCNSGYDLSEESYAVTRKFADTGRGVLLGHDTVCGSLQSSCYRPFFNQFADDLGLIVKFDELDNGMSDTATVVKKGLITEYPWMLRGELNVPEWHTSNQYCNKGTEWMIWNGERLTDEETGAKAAFYLATKNNFGIIQTGNSDGCTTDDEKKVLANTLFYLYQNTSNTSTADNAFFDTDAPANIHLLDASVSEGIMKLHVQAEDKPTVYEYYAKAKLGSNSIKTNVQKHEALSGMAGFAGIITDSDKSAMELIVSEEDGKTVKDMVEADEKGNADLTIALKDGTGPQFLHIFAVDKSGNISELTAPLSDGSEEKIKLGDVNFDGQVNAVDASMILAEYARISTEQTPEFSDKQFIAGDVDENGVIDAVDASKVLAYYAYASTGGELDDMRDWMALTARSDGNK
ncbi:dockerin type I domain-containing protein [Ruminococcus sp.]|uniref:dockerin type I domain-containing protein n=1 Tax=Ruminococcus sp. TaxID=41978 RepID=UPI0025EF56A4|nr:dockerin type I domain-containing protein [Ruminococcus sp.]